MAEIKGVATAEADLGGFVTVIEETVDDGADEEIPEFGVELDTILDGKFPPCIDGWLELVFGVVIDKLLILSVLVLDVEFIMGWAKVNIVDVGLVAITLDAIELNGGMVAVFDVTGWTMAC